MATGEVRHLEQVPALLVEAVLRAAGRRFAALPNPYDVQGWLIAPKRICGREQEGQTLRVLVPVKLERPSKRVPTLRFTFENQRYSVQPDVVGVGQGRTHRRTTIRYSGLHHSCAIRVGRVKGAVSVLLSDGSGSGPSHLVTAGHLFSPNAAGGAAKVWAARTNRSREIQIGTLRVNLLDERKPKDGALVSLTAGGRALAQLTSGAGKPPGLRQMFPSDLDPLIPACVMYRATTGDFSSQVLPQRHQGTIVVPDGFRDFVAIVDPVLSSSIGEEGDSGGLLHDLEQSSAVGSYVGRKGDLAIFESLRSLVARFPEPDTGPFKIWNDTP